MTMHKLFINGKPISSDKQFPLPNENSHFVFESLRSYGGVIFRLKEHLNRLLESAKTIHLDLYKTLDEIEQELQSCLAQTSKKEAFIQISLDGKNSYILITERKRPLWIYQKGIDLKTSVMRKNMPNAISSEIKTSAFITNVLAIAEKREESLYDVILLDPNGFVAEATIWNLFMIKEGKIFTPATGILHGVTRQFVIECALLEHLPVVESQLTRHDLWNADEAFLTNTSGEVVPIRTVDDRRIGKKIPGDVTRRLMSRFRKELNKELNHENQAGDY